MTDKIIYFTAGEKPTVDEAAEIAQLNALTPPRYEVVVRRADANAYYGNNADGGRLEPCDYVAYHSGTDIPSDYDEVTVFDPEDEPAAVADDDEIVVSNSAGSNSQTAIIAVTAGVPSAKFGATTQIVDNSDTVVVKNSAGSVTKNGTASVASGVITGVALASGEAIVTNGATFAGVTGSGTNATITVTNGVISAIALSA